MPKGKQEWVSFGSTGRMRNPAWARSEADVKSHAKVLGETLAYLLSPPGPHFMNAHLKLWYAIQNVKTYLDDAEKNLLEDLFQLGAFVPEKFDIQALKDSKPPTKKKKR